MGAQQDRELLLEVRAGRVDGFATLYRRHRDVVLAFLARRVSGPELAADLLAETFAALLVLVRDDARALPEVPVAWLLLTARHMLIDSYRRGRVEDQARQRLGMRPLVIEDEDLERIEAISEAIDIAQVLAAQLTHEQWYTLRARVIDERDYPSIASELGCSEAVVRQRVSRALKNLRNALED